LVTTDAPQSDEPTFSATCSSSRGGWKRARISINKPKKKNNIAHLVSWIAYGSRIGWLDDYQWQTRITFRRRSNEHKQQYMNPKHLYKKTETFFPFYFLYFASGREDSLLGDMTRGTLASSFLFTSVFFSCSDNPATAAAVGDLGVLGPSSSPCNIRAKSSVLILGISISPRGEVGGSPAMGEDTVDLVLGEREVRPKCGERGESVDPMGIDAPFASDPKQHKK
jgi:hypothetical protein